MVRQRRSDSRTRKSSRAHARDRSGPPALPPCRPPIEDHHQSAPRQRLDEDETAIGCHIPVRMIAYRIVAERVDDDLPRGHARPCAWRARLDARGEEPRRGTVMLDIVEPPAVAAPHGFLSGALGD